MTDIGFSFGFLGFGYELKLGFSDIGMIDNYQSTSATKVAPAKT